MSGKDIKTCPRCGHELDDEERKICGDEESMHMLKSRLESINDDFIEDQVPYLIKDIEYKIEE